MSRSFHQPVIDDVKWPTSKSKKWADEWLSAVTTEDKVLAVVIFGSSVRPVSESYDLDLLYLFREKPPNFRPPPIEVDLRAYEIQKVPRLLEAGHDLLTWALRFGRAIFERDSIWTNLKRDWQDKVPFPDSSVARARAAKSFALLKELEQVGDTDAAFEQWVTYLTHVARAELIDARVFPGSRPELVGQLELIKKRELANDLRLALTNRNKIMHQELRHRDADYGRLAKA